MIKTDHEQMMNSKKVQQIQNYYFAVFFNSLVKICTNIKYQIADQCKNKVIDKFIDLLTTFQDYLNLINQKEFFSKVLSALSTNYCT
jgi:hypothetical protein